MQSPNIPRNLLKREREKKDVFNVFLNLNANTKKQPFAHRPVNEHDDDTASRKCCVSGSVEKAKVHNIKDSGVGSGHSLRVVTGISAQQRGSSASHHRRFTGQLVAQARSRPPPDWFRPATAPASGRASAACVGSPLPSASTADPDPRWPRSRGSSPA